MAEGEAECCCAYSVLCRWSTLADYPTFVVGLCGFCGNVCGWAKDKISKIFSGSFLNCPERRLCLLSVSLEGCANI